MANVVGYIFAPIVFPADNFGCWKALSCCLRVNWLAVIFDFIIFQTFSLFSHQFYKYLINTISIYIFIKKRFTFHKISHCIKQSTISISIQVYLKPCWKYPLVSGSLLILYWTKNDHWFFIPWSHPISDILGRLCNFLTF